MPNIDNFKMFVRRNPTLAQSVRRGKTSWQELYELYDLYGENSNVFDKYINEKNTSSYSFNNIFNTIRNIDINKLQNSINSLEKAINLFSDIVVKDSKEESYNPRSTYKRFDD